MGMVIPQVIFAISLLGGGKVYGSSPELPSLFFPEEAGSVIQNPGAHLTVGALVWTGPGEWVFWVGQERVTPRSPHPLFEVVEVTAQQVRVKWHKTGEEEILKPGVSVRIP